MQSTMRPLLEVCCSRIDDAIAAQAAGADRIELCAGLRIGGLTPGAGLIRATTTSVSIPVRVLIRPREGHFVWNEREKRLIVDEIKTAMDAGAEGVVLGGLDEHGNLDQRLITMALRAVSAEHITFHRAFDECVNLSSAYQLLCRRKIDCVLTSGRARTAPAGAEFLRQLVRLNGTTRVMAGGGVRPHNLQVLRSFGVTAVHFSARRNEPSPFPHQLFDDVNSVVDAEIVAAMRKALDS